MSFNLSDLFPELYPQLTPAEIAERRRTEESTPAERSRNWKPPIRRKRGHSERRTLS